MGVELQGPAFAFKAEFAVCLGGLGLSHMKVCLNTVPQIRVDDSGNPEGLIVYWNSKP